MALDSATWNRISRIAIVAAFGILYWYTLDTGLQPGELHGGDLITHQYAQVQARPSNAPGYPVYTMGGWLWFHAGRSLLTALGDHLPNPMPILSSYSTLWALLSLLLFYLILERLWNGLDATCISNLAAVLLTAFLGVTYFFWYYATTTEQYSSAVAQTLAIIYVYLRWSDDSFRLRWLLVLAFLSGLSLAHMLTVAFIVPALVVAVLWQQPGLFRSPRAIAASVVAAAAPLVSYAYVYIRGAAHPEWWGQGEWTDPVNWFWSFVGTAQGRSELAWAFESGRPLLGNGFPQLIWGELSWPLLIVGLIGVFRLPRRLNVVTVGTLVIYLGFCWFYRFGNWFQVILPAYPLILIGVAQCIHDLSTSRSRAGRIFLVVALAGMAVAVGWRAYRSFPAADSRHRAGDTALDSAVRLMGPWLPPGAALFAAVDDALALDYLTQIWGVRSDLDMVSSREADALLSDGQPVFTTPDVAPTLLSELTFVPHMGSQDGVWIRLSADHAATEPALSLHVPITSGVSLAGYSAFRAELGRPVLRISQPVLDILLFWDVPSGTWPPFLNISLRPISKGKPVTDSVLGVPLQMDRSAPVHGLWSGDAQYTQVVDGYRFPADGDPEAVRLIVYTAGSSGFSNLAEIELPLAP